MKHNYNFIYHYNTYSKQWGAMTRESVGHYFNRDEQKGDYTFGKTMSEASEKLTEQLEEAVTA